MKSIHFLWEKQKGVRYKTVIALILSVVASVMVIINPYLSKYLIDYCIMGDGRDFLLPLLGIMCGVVFIKTLIQTIRMVLLEKSSQHMLINIRKSVYSNIQNQDMDFFREVGTGDIITRVTGDLEYLRHFCAFVIYHIIEAIFMFVSSIVILMFINKTLTLALLSVVPFLVFTSFLYSKYVRGTFKDMRKSLSVLNGAASENIDGNRVVKAFVTEEAEIEKFSKYSEKYKELNLKAAFKWQTIVPLMNLFAESLSVITLLVGGVLAINGEITLGDLTLFSGLTWALSTPMKRISALLNDIQQFSTSAEKVMELCEAKAKIKDPENPVEEEIKNGEIEFKNVYFKYGDDYILNDISFKVNSGETIVIMGPTGCGKTTLINLLIRFYDTMGGEILVDGIDIKKRSLKSLRDGIAVATQNVFLFSDTIEGNIAFSDVNMSENDVKDFSEKSCSDEFIKNTPEGYDTIIGERGVGLSGGQKQRLALARAMAAKAAVLVLDDTTSAVDMETEKKIQKSLDGFLQTKIIIAQRISTAKYADRIFIMENGRITAGTHEELSRSNEYYKSILKLQTTEE